MSQVFDVKDPAESVPLTFDFTIDLASGEVLSGVPTVTLTVASGVDATPGNVLNGTPVFDATNKKVLIPVKGGIDGVSYKFVVTVNTSNAYKVLTLSAILPVVR